MKSYEKITLRNMLYWGFVGASDWEREVPTRIEVDVEVQADLRAACKSDNLNDTIDYASVYELAGKVISARHHNLIESLAEEVAQAVLELHDSNDVVVRIRKPNPPVGGACDYAEIEIVRTNENRCG